MRFNKPRGHKDKGAQSLKWAYQSIAKLDVFIDTKKTGSQAGQRFGKVGVHYSLML